jgi:hypothetical protein
LGQKFDGGDWHAEGGVGPCRSIHHESVVSVLPRNCVDVVKAMSTAPVLNANGGSTLEIDPAKAGVTKAAVNPIAARDVARDPAATRRRSGERDMTLQKAMRGRAGAGYGWARLSVRTPD